jgi:hypothetical protein
VACSTTTTAMRPDRGSVIFRDTTGATDHEPSHVDTRGRRTVFACPTRVLPPAFSRPCGSTCSDRFR